MDHEGERIGDIRIQDDKEEARFMDENGINWSNCELLDQVSDVIRIVDPLHKQVMGYKKQAQAALVGEIHCFDFWTKNKVCDNCISIRAYYDNTTYVKIEYKKDKIYMVTAVPYPFENGKIVVEMIKDITKNFFFDFNDGAAIDAADIHALIDNMNKLAFSDALTGIYNRRYIMEKLPVDLLNSVLLSTDLSIIMVDIDYFKQVNDQYGHLAGDHTLKNVAEVLSGCIKRDNDWIAKFGGEEFVICMPGAGLETAKKTAEHMCRSVEHTPIQYEGKEIGVTVSIGIHSLKLHGSESAEDLIRCADEKLYLAKRNGRNRIAY